MKKKKAQYKDPVTGKFAKDPNAQPKPQKEKRPRLQGEKGRFISGEKEEIIYELAKVQGETDVQAFLKRTLKENPTFKKFVEHSETTYSFNSEKIENALANKDIRINGKKVTKGEAYEKIQKVTSLLKNKAGAFQLEFTGTLKNKNKNEARFKTENFNRLDINLPNIRRINSLLKKFENDEIELEELQELLEDEGITIHLSDPKKNKK